MLIALLLTTLAAVSSPVPLDQAERVFTEARLASEDDAGRLWGAPLYGATILVDPKTRFVVANQRDADGALEPTGSVFTGTLPVTVPLANTGVSWSGTRWTMILWPSLGDRIVPRRRLLMHESWHRIQDTLGFKAQESAMPELETVAGRFWLQLELRALESALRNTGEKRKQSIRDALSFRVRRRALHETLGARERALESNEGLAEYTGWKLGGTSDVETRLAFAERLSRLDRSESFSRAMAYYTGPAYGLLLDATAPGWTRRFKPGDDVADVLAEAARVSPARIAGTPTAYGAAELRVDEERRDSSRRERTVRYRRVFVEGPTLTLPMANAKYSFDPTQVFSLDGVGSVYPKLEVTADWGSVSAMSDALITSDFTRFVLAMPGERNGWTMKLNPAWEIRPAARAGSLTVAPKE